MNLCLTLNYFYCEFYWHLHLGEEQKIICTNNYTPKFLLSGGY